MKMTCNKTILNTAITLVLGGASLSAQAVLTTSAVLNFVPGELTCSAGGTYPNCDYDAVDVTGGSYLALDVEDDGIDADDRIALTMDGGIHIGSIQTLGIDNWTLWGSAGEHTVSTPITVVNDDVNGDGGYTKALDFSGWGMIWNGSPTGLGGDPANFPGDTQLAIITCSTVSCSAGSTFVLDYQGHSPVDDPSMWANVDYALHLEGTVSTVPVPAAAWLFGSGLLGLLGLARKNKQSRFQPVMAN